MTFPRALFRTTVPVALLATVAAGCGSAPRPAADASAVNVSERDFHISAPTRLRAGEVTFRVHNEGPERHEFIVARDGDSGLPLRSDGLTIDEEAVHDREVGELEPGDPGSIRTLHIKLAPGHYVFFCNMAGHYLGGMRHEVVVE